MHLMCAAIDKLYLQCQYINVVVQQKALLKAFFLDMNVTVKNLKSVVDCYRNMAVMH